MKFLQIATAMVLLPWLAATASSPGDNKPDPGRAGAAPEATLEVIDPFDVWIEGERWSNFIKVTNTGTEPFPLLHAPDIGPVQISITAGFADEPPASHHSTFPPLPSVEDTNWQEIDGVDHSGKLVLNPGESYVYGFEAFVATEGLWQLGSRGMQNYQIHLLIGENRWVSSSEMEREFIVNPSAWEAEPMTEVPLPASDLKSPIRLIEIDDVVWIFKNRARLCRLPNGATPVFDTSENHGLLTIGFPDHNEDPVVIDNRTSRPVSGSSKTVPHLHVWESLGSPRKKAPDDSDDAINATGNPVAENPAVDEDGPGSHLITDASRSTFPWAAILLVSVFSVSLAIMVARNRNMLFIAVMSCYISAAQEVPDRESISGIH